MRLPEWQSEEIARARDQQRNRSTRDSFATITDQDRERSERLAFERWFQEYTIERYPEYNVPLDDLREYQADQHRRRQNLEVTLGALLDASWLAWKSRAAAT